MDDGEFFKQVLRDILDKRSLAATRTSQDAGLGRDMISDVFSGRKKAVSITAVAALARYLQP